MTRPLRYSPLQSLLVPLLLPFATSLLAAEVPIASGLSPQEAVEAMTALDGFQARLVAAEPDVHQPIAMAFDDQGRLWVAEAYTYPIRAPEGQGKDRIIILSDLDGDRRFEQRKVFAEGLNLVSGLEVGFGGVWVGAAPYLLFIPDRDGDDRPDGEPQILLDGFGYQDTHETLNAFIWGPDGWLYGCHGVFTHSRVGKPGTPDDQRIPMNAAVWRYHPTQHQFEVFSWGTSNPWGVDFNDYGQPFITACVIPHLWHVIQGARYERQGGQHFNPHIYDEIKTIAKHRHYAGDIRDHAWWGQEPNTPADTLAAGGGHAHCGAMIYLGDNWPEQFRNQIFMHNVHGNRINQDRLERLGSGYVGDRAPDVLLANDRWFRGINLKYGPDGTVYLIDWYDPNACHRTNPEIWDRSNGRIFNLAYGEPTPVTVHLSTLDDTALVQLQLHPNDWFVRIARRILQERFASGTLNTAEVHQALKTILTENPDVTRRLRAIWAMHVTGGLNEAARLALMTDDEEYVRAWAVQLELEDRIASNPTLARLERMAREDSSPVVRLYLASALQRMPNDQRWPIAAALLSHAEDTDDHNLPQMYWYGIEPLVESNPPAAITMARQSSIPRLTELIVRRASASDASLDAVVAWLNDGADVEQQRMILNEMSRAFEGRVGIPMPPAWNTAFQSLQTSDDPAIRQRADEIAILLGDRRVYPKMRDMLSNPEEDLARRAAALQTLVRGQDREAAEAFFAAMDHPSLRAAAIRALVICDHPQTPQQILAHYPQFSADEKRSAIGTLTTRKPYALALIDAMEQGHVPTADMHAYDVRQLLGFGDDELNQRLTEVWGAFRQTSEDRQQRIADIKALCSPDNMRDASAGNGRRLFALTCAKCHTLFGEGDIVGPDITGSNRANLDYILENILDPSAVLGNDYRMTLFELVDGRVISGLIQRETDSAVTVRTLDDTIVIPLDEIDFRQLSPLSMMPEGLLDTFTESDVRDLIAYLASPTQVPISGPPAPIDPTTGHVEGATEGETMEVVGKTQGQVITQAMQAFGGGNWSGRAQLWWTQARPDDRLELRLPVPKTGIYDVEVVLTRAPDYAIVQASLGEQPLGEPLDLYAPQVVSTGVLVFPDMELEAGDQRLILEIRGANSHAVKSYMVGLDYVRLVPK